MKLTNLIVLVTFAVGCAPQAGGAPHARALGGHCTPGSSRDAAGECVCDPFFEGPACKPAKPRSNLRKRSAGDVCAIWNSGSATPAANFWLVEPQTKCFPGTLHPDQLRAALRETSRYRMLVGLYPVGLTTDELDATQQCATMHDAMNVGLTHYPPSDWACYSPRGYEGCSKSNLHMGFVDPAKTVESYIRDQGVPSLGHRRWIFNPRMGATAFGQRGRFGAMYALDDSRDHEPDFVAYPPPGPFPIEALNGKWSVHGGAEYGDGFAVSLMRDDGSELAVTNVTAPHASGMASTLSWEVESAALTSETAYRISIRDGIGRRVHSYETTLVSCGER